MESLHTGIKTLCQVSPYNNTGSTENIQIDGISYDVVVAHTSTSKFLKSVGSGYATALFLNDRLISLHSSYPNVELDTLKTKYGKPEVVDGREIQVCKNRIGNEFENNVGQLDAVWVNGGVKSIFRVATTRPRETCTDGGTITFYILEETRQVKIIKDAIEAFRAELSKKQISDSPFRNIRPRRLSSS